MNIEKRASPIVQTGCGENDFMMRDGVCDEATNMERCLYDGGDCCLENKDTLMCKVCTCKLKVDNGLLDNGFKELEVKQLKHSDDFDSIVTTVVAKVDQMLSQEVCSVLCLLEHDKRDQINAWHYNKGRRQCQCAWIESIYCNVIEKNLDQSVMDVQTSVFDSTSAFIQMNKTIPCG